MCDAAASGATVDLSYVQRELALDLQRHLEHMWRVCDERSRAVLMTLARGNGLTDRDEPTAAQLVRKGYIKVIGERRTLSSVVLSSFTVEKLADGGAAPFTMTIEPSASLDAASKMGIKSEIVSLGGIPLSDDVLVSAAFTSSDAAVKACISIKQLLSYGGVECKGVVGHPEMGDKGVTAPKTDTQMLTSAEFGEIVTPTSVIAELSKPLARKFRRQVRPKDTGELPRVFVLKRASSPSKSVFVGRPIPKVNNVWYEYRSSDIVFVFVHGIFSDSRSCWYNHEADVLWPD